MQSTESNGTIHQGRNVKRFREMLGIKQDDLAFELNVTQQTVSLIEQRETIDDDLLEQISELLKVPVDVLKNFDTEDAVNFIANTFNQSGLFNRDCTLNFHPIDKLIEALDKNESYTKDCCKAKRKKMTCCRRW